MARIRCKYCKEEHKRVYLSGLGSPFKNTTTPAYLCPTCDTPSASDRARCERINAPAPPPDAHR